MARNYLFTCTVILCAQQYENVWMNVLNVNNEKFRSLLRKLQDLLKREAGMCY